MLGVWPSLASNLGDGQRVSRGLAVRVSSVILYKLFMLGGLFASPVCGVFRANLYLFVAQSCCCMTVDTVGILGWIGYTGSLCHWAVAWRRDRRQYLGLRRCFSPHCDCAVAQQADTTAIRNPPSAEVIGDQLAVRSAYRSAIPPVRKPVISACGLWRVMGVGFAEYRHVLDVRQRESQPSMKIFSSCSPRRVAMMKWISDVATRNGRL